VERVQNLLTFTIDDDGSEAPPGHDFVGDSLTQLVGAVATGMGIYEIAPGNASWPYHFEIAEEEWLIVIEGELTLRTPEGETVMRTGDVAAFPAGAAGAHAVRNHTDARVRYVMPSTRARYGGASIYPDSGKFGIAAPGFRHRGRLGEPVEYWEGES
jgi:uncharacterized cupin superfamily protein